MFIGHFAIAFVLVLLFPHVPVWVPLVGVSFPDLLWGILVLLRREEVLIDSDNPLQKTIVFKKFPYSHSLVLTSVLAFGVGGLFSAGLNNLLVLVVFILASVSHWLLDTMVHLSDLPVLGFDGDRKVGFGLWRWGKIAFLVEFGLFALFAILFVRSASLLPILIVGVVFHGINANSFFGASKKNPFSSSSAYAAAALFGFGAISALYSIFL